MFRRITPVLRSSVRGLCARPYPLHPKGCPNFGKASRCPPSAPLLGEVYDLSLPCYVVWTVFDLGAHVARLRKKYPGWSRRQLYCCLYWQPKARSNLAKACAEFIHTHYAYTYTAETCPEAMGMDVTATMKSVGIVLEWPPVTKAFQVAFVGVPKKDRP